MTQTMHDQTAFNPAFAGSNNKICVNAFLRQWNWMKFGEGTPKTSIFSVNSPIKLPSFNFGLGLTAISDEIGFEKKNGIKLAISYGLNINKKGNLRFGIDFGMLGKKFDGEWKAPETDNDELIPTHSENKNVFDLSAGLFYKTKKYYAGFSALHLNSATFKINETDANPYLHRHYFLNAGYFYQLTNPIFEINPNFSAKYDGVVMQMSFNFNLIYNKKYWGGVIYKTGGVFSLNGGIKMDNGIMIGGAYDLNTTSIIKHSSGSFEIIIAYCFDLDMNKKNQKYRSVRFL